MMWFLTGRRLVSALQKERWNGRAQIRANEAIDFSKWDYWRNGVPERDFLDSLFKVEVVDCISAKRPFKFIIGKINTRFRPNYIRQFRHRAADLLRKCEEEGYITHSANSGLMVSTKGEDLISFWYYPKLVINHPVTEHVIKWGAITLIIWLLTKHGIKIGFTN